MATAAARGNGREPLLTAPFLCLWAVSFTAFLAAFQLFPTLPFRILELGGSQAQAGWFLAVYTWASALSAPLTGALADRVGRRRLLRIAAVSFLGFTALYGVVASLPVLLVVGCLHGVFWSALLSASGALITEVIPLSRRTEGLAYWGMAPTAAISFAPVIGLAAYRLGWWAVIAVVGLCALLLVGLAAAIQVDRPRRAAASAARLLHWRVTAAAGTIFAIAFGYGGITSYVAVMAVERQISPPSIFFTAFALTVLVSRVAVGRFGDRMGAEALVLPSLLAVPPALLLLGRAETAGAMVAAGILFGLGFGGATPGFLAWVLARTDAAHRGAVFGSVLFAMDTAIGAGSLLIGRLVAGPGYVVAFDVGAAVAAFGLPVFFLARRLLPQPA